MHFLYPALQTLAAFSSLVVRYFSRCAQSLQSCLTLCDAMDCSMPGPSLHGFLQAGILEWVALPCSKGSSRPRARTQVSPIAGRFFTTQPLGSPLLKIPPGIFFPSLKCHCLFFFFFKLISSSLEKCYFIYLL